MRASRQAFEQDRHAADIKPDNIFIDYADGVIACGEPTITQVRISDLEDSALLQPGPCFKGCLCGNALWRRPARPKACRPTCTRSASRRYTSCWTIWCSAPATTSSAGIWPGGTSCGGMSRTLGTEEGFHGLLNYLGEENLFYKRLIVLAGDFDAERPRKPFQHWHYVNEGLRDLVGRMTNLDPKRRMSAREALQHLWFGQAKSE